MKKIKIGDLVQVINGKDSGKRGEIIKVISLKSSNKEKVIIKGLNIAKKSQKPNPQLGIKGGIVEIERGIDISNVMYIDKSTDKPTRVGFKINETGKKVRFSKKSGEIID